MTYSTMETPYPFDHISPWQPPGELDATLASLVLSAFPPGSTIAGTASYRPGYMRYPLRVRVQTVDGTERICVLKADALHRVCQVHDLGL